MTRRRNKKKKVSLEIILELALLIGLVPLLYELFVIEETIRQYVNAPIYSCTVAYYKCGGTNKNPKVCPVMLKERVDANN